MGNTTIAQYAVLVIFVINIIMLVSLILLKASHRRAMAAHDRLYEQHLASISTHLSGVGAPVVDFGDVSSSAFLDALIDVRNALAGPEVEAVNGLISDFGVIDRLTRSLRRRWPRGRRLRAAVALAELGEESSAQLLVEHLHDSDPEVRVQAARGLGRMRYTPAIDEIVARFGDEEPWVRSRFGITLVEYGPLATWPLAAYVRVNNSYERAGTITALQTMATIADPQAVDPILEVFRASDDIEVILASIEALGLIGVQAAAPEILDGLTAEDWRVRAKVASAIGDLGYSTACPNLARSMRDSNFWVRRNSANALTRLDGGTWFLLEALEGNDPYAADSAAEAMVDRGDLTRARDRFREGTATEEDFKLLAFIEEDKVVAS